MNLFFFFHFRLFFFQYLILLLCCCCFCFCFIIIFYEIVASNDDLLKQILVKLPLKPLMRFTSVSKHWLSLISGPDFCHRRKPPCCVSGPFIESPWDNTEFKFVDLSQSSNPSYPPSESITFFNNSSQLKILQSCNGLLLCSTNEAQEPKEYYVDNPTTRTYAILPPLPFRYRSVWGMSLAFDPSKSSHYKVLCVLSQTIDDDHDDDTYDVDDTQIAIYSSETQTWRLSGDSFYSPDTNIFSKGVFQIQI
ncbi:hypothetical protein UlMin_026418 [Ulmus minor]